MERLYIETDDFFPNHSRFPVIKYKGALFEMEGKVMEKGEVEGGEEVVSEEQKAQLMRFLSFSIFSSLKGFSQKKIYQVL